MGTTCTEGWRNIWEITCCSFMIREYLQQIILQPAPIVIKGTFVIVNQNSLVIFGHRTLYSFMPLFLPGKIDRISFRCGTDKYVGVLSIYPGILL